MIYRLYLIIIIIEIIVNDLNNNSLLRSCSLQLFYYSSNINQIEINILYLYYNKNNNNIIITIKNYISYKKV